MALPGLAEPGARTMAQRHEIQNPARRGNVFYWRPRVPARFTGQATGSRLSLGHRQSDHRKAAYVARRLNIPLHDLALMPTADPKRISHPASLETRPQAFCPGLYQRRPPH